MARQLKNEAVSSEDDSEPSRLFLLPSHCATGSERRHYIFPLPRPNTEEHSMFMATDSGDLMELAKYQMEHESFTADGPFETALHVFSRHGWQVACYAASHPPESFRTSRLPVVHSSTLAGRDQPVYMATPVDALFFALAPLYKHNDRFWPLKDIVEDCLLLKVIRSCSDRMQHIADVEGLGKDQVYCYNESKCLAWLTKKVKAVAARLQSIGIPPPAACSSAASAGSSGGIQPTSAWIQDQPPPSRRKSKKHQACHSLRKRSSNKCSSRKVTTKAHRRILCRSQPRKRSPNKCSNRRITTKAHRRILCRSQPRKRSPNKCSNRRVTTKAHRRILCRSQPRKRSPNKCSNRRVTTKAHRRILSRSQPRHVARNFFLEKPKTPRTAVRQKREKAAKAGMKSISSYFAKK
ncbi:uncharacterized protein LOC144114734 isoform X15 [Amblyomma americanum]